MTEYDNNNGVERASNPEAVTSYEPVVTNSPVLDGSGIYKELSNHDPLKVIGKPLGDFFFGLSIFLLSQLAIAPIAIFSYVLIFGANARELMEMTDPNVVIVTLYSSSLFAIGMIAWWSHRRNRTPANFLYLKTPQLKDFGWAIGMVAIGIIFGLIMTAILGTNDKSTTEINAALWPENMNTLEATLLGIGIAFVVPIAEELMFRGVMLTSLARKIHPYVALVISAILFALPHIFNFLFLKDITTNHVIAGLSQIFVLGFLFGWVLLHTKRLVPCIIAHIINNSIVVISIVVEMNI